MNSLTDQQLLRDYSGQRSEAAFTELVRRHIDFVYSAALRMVCDTHLAQDVTQGVFVALARNARQLTAHPVLSGWLHRTAQNIAAQTIRTDVRRRAREQEAATMNELLSAEPETIWEHIAPQLDTALGELGDADRDALLLRYFEHKSAREMGQTLGISDDAAQKRVNRAVERLREFFAKRGVTVSASGLAVVISANAVQAAPVGLAITISTATLAGTAIITTATVTKAIVMTTLQKTLLAAAVAAAIGTGIFAARQYSQFRSQIQALQEQQAPLDRQIQELQKERADHTNRLAMLTAENANLKKRPAEVLKLRGEVSRLHQENASARTNSAFGKITSDPETRKMIRDQQKMAMASIYSDFIKNLNLPKDQADKLKDLLADSVMDNVDQITAIRRDGKTTAEMNQIFADQNAALLEKVGNLLGPDGLAQYQDYTQNLASHLTALQFEDQLTGDAAAKAEKSKELYQVMQTATQQALAGSGLPANYQVVPLLNSSNIASEAQGEQSLQLLNTIYQNAASQAGSFLSPGELSQFQEFATAAINNNRMALTLNRKMMSPGTN